MKIAARLPGGPSIVRWTTCPVRCGEDALSEVAGVGRATTVPAGATIGCAWVPLNDWPASTVESRTYTFELASSTSIPGCDVALDTLVDAPSIVDPAISAVDWKSATPGPS